MFDSRPLTLDSCPLSFDSPITQWGPKHHDMGHQDCAQRQQNHDRAYELGTSNTPSPTCSFQFSFFICPINALYHLTTLTLSTYPIMFVNPKNRWTAWCSSPTVSSARAAMYDTPFKTYPPLSIPPFLPSIHALILPLIPPSFLYPGHATSPPHPDRKSVV